MKSDNAPLHVSFGTNCKDASHSLRQVPLISIYQYIKEGNAGLIKETQLLRTVLSYDANRYTTMKTRLPYIPTSSFDPPIRKIENFKQAQGMIIDIDWKKGFDQVAYKTLIADPRVVMAYKSPSGLGAKLLLLFDKVITDAHQYSVMYKHIANALGMQYKILEFIDFKNADVSRISFLCYDPLAHYQLDPLPIAVTDNEHMQVPVQATTSQDNIPHHIYREILTKLDTRPKVVNYQPPLIEEIEGIFSQIKESLMQYGITVTHHQPIQYGVKIVVTLGKHKGEVNIYHGKKGYSIISTAKKGTDPQLNETAKHVLETILPQY